MFYFKFFGEVRPCLSKITSSLLGKVYVIPGGFNDFLVILNNIVRVSIYRILNIILCELKQNSLNPHSEIVLFNSNHMFS